MLSSLRTRPLRIPRPASYLQPWLQQRRGKAETTTEANATKSESTAKTRATKAKAITKEKATKTEAITKEKATKAKKKPNILESADGTEKPALRRRGKTVLTHLAERGDKDEWLRKISLSEKYPVTAELRANTTGSTKSDMITSHRVKSWYIRPQVVSPELCDDVLKLIGPSLEAYKGCDILDINPGAGIWSQKLHDFLQPRNHVLLESPNDPFTPFLEPLTQTPGSTYKLVHADPCVWATYTKLFDDGYFPDQKRVDPDEPQKLNTSLLVTGQLMWDPKMMGIGVDNMARQMLASFFRFNFTNEAIHANGPARMLFWALSDDASAVSPHSASQLNKLHLHLHQTCEKLIEVAGPSFRDQAPEKGGVRYGSRAPRLLFESMVLTAQREKESGIDIPAHRRDPAHSLLPDILRLSNGTGRLTTTEARDFLEAKFNAGFDVTGLISGQHHDIFKLAYAVAHEGPPSPEDIASGVATFKGTKFGRYSTPTSREYNIKKASVKRVLTQETLVEAAAVKAEALYHAECAILRMPDGPEKDAAIKTLQEELKPAFVAMKAKVNKNHSSRVATDTDERILLDGPVPRLHWDARPYEPLVVDPEEVWPRLPVNLLDVTPRPRPAHMSRVDWEYFQDTVDGLSKNIEDNVLSALDRMQHGASALADEVPSLRDPDKGGRYDLEQLSVRMLTGEMLEGITNAFREWPFKHPDANHPKYFRVRNRMTSGKRGRGFM